MLWKKIFNNQEEVIMEEVMAEEEKVENNIGCSQVLCFGTFVFSMCIRAMAFRKDRAAWLSPLPIGI
jgi:hypothetical protein